MGKDDINPLAGIGTVPTCQKCGSERVVKDAWACWNRVSGLWELETTFDQEYCLICEADTHFVWQVASPGPNLSIRQLNDDFRMRGKGNGLIVVTAGVKTLGDVLMTEAFLAIKDFTAFDEDSDPWGEHDFGAVTIADQKIFWKIDYYNPTLTQGSENPGNPALTKRVLTIMLASEY